MTECDSKTTVQMKDADFVTLLNANKGTYSSWVTGTDGYPTFGSENVAPTVTTGTANNVTSSAATLTGNVNANGTSTAVTFEYGTTTSYGSSVTASPATAIGTSGTSVSGALSGLENNTTYHYRVKAVSKGGTTYGSDMTFSTDTTAPTILSASWTDDTHITVTLSEACQSLIKANDGGFTVTKNGTATTFAVSATAQGADSSHVVLTVADMSTAGSAGVTVTYTAGGNGTITDTAGNVLATTTTGAVISGWDITAPTIQFFWMSAANTYIDITFSEGVYGNSDGSTALSAEKLALTFTQNGGTATNVVISSIKEDDNPTEGLASVLTGGETTVRVFLTVTGTPNGLETIEIKPANGTSVYDKAGNAMLSSQTSGVKQLNDTTALTVSSVSVPAPKTYKAGETLSFTVNFSKAVTVTGMPTLILDIGGDAVNADYVSGNNTSALVFAYTIVDGNSDANGIDVSELDLNGGAIKDAAGNDALLTLNSVGSAASVLVDTNVPTAGNSGTIGVSELTYHSAKLTWTKGTDDITLEENLQYKVVYSTSSITTVAAADALSGTWIADIATATVTGLTANTDYYFNVLVKDQAGNMAIYSAATGKTTVAPSSGGTPAPAEVRR